MCLSSACDEWTVLPRPGLHRDANRFGHSAVVSNGWVSSFCISLLKVINAWLHLGNTVFNVNTASPLELQWFTALFSDFPSLMLKSGRTGKSTNLLWYINATEPHLFTKTTLCFGRLHFYISLMSSFSVLCVVEALTLSVLNILLCLCLSHRLRLCCVYGLISFLSVIFRCSLHFLCHFSEALCWGTWAVSFPLPLLSTWVFLLFHTLTFSPPMYRYTMYFTLLFWQLYSYFCYSWLSVSVSFHSHRNAGQSNSSSHALYFLKQHSFWIVVLQTIHSDTKNYAKFQIL